jgi:hypothetical protein
MGSYFLPVQVGFFQHCGHAAQIIRQRRIAVAFDGVSSSAACAMCSARNWHPHVHALVTEGVFLPEKDAFLPLPKLATEPFLKLWEQEVFALLLAEGKITQDIVAKG